MTNYRAQAYEWAPGYEAAIDAAAGRLHRGESSHMHNPGDEDTQHGACSYCWLRAGRAVRGFLDAGLINPAPTAVWRYADEDDMGSEHVYTTEGAATDAAAAAYTAEDPESAAGTLTWRPHKDYMLLDDDGRYTGWSVDRIPVAPPAPVAEEAARA